jgi:hypothetical protein
MTISSVPALLPAGSLADLQLAKLFSVVGFLSIPLGVLLVLVLYQLLLLLIGTVECATMAKYEVTPLLHHIKNITQQVDGISTKVNSGLGAIEGSVNQTVAYAQPMMKKTERLAEKGAEKIRVVLAWLKNFG